LFSSFQIKSGNEAQNQKPKGVGRITPRHIMMAIKKDEEIDRLLENVTISNSGVIPHIHEGLLKHKNATKTSKVGQKRTQETVDGANGADKSTKPTTSKGKKASGGSKAKSGGSGSEKEREEEAGQSGAGGDGDESGDGYPEDRDDDDQNKKGQSKTDDNNEEKESEENEEESESEEQSVADTKRMQEETVNGLVDHAPLSQASTVPVSEDESVEKVSTKSRSRSRGTYIFYIYKKMTCLSDRIDESINQIKTF
jgi:hypothetical protein